MNSVCPDLTRTSTNIIESVKLSRLEAALRTKTFLILNLFLLVTEAHASEVAITIDDPTVAQTPLYSPEKRNQLILESLRTEGVKAALFVCGKRVDNPEGRQLLQSWDDGGHLISNHTYSHENYNSNPQTFDLFSADILKNEPLISGLQNFRKLLRFPMLKEGNTAYKRDEMRKFLKAHGYQQGYVTIDASDWYIDGRLIARLKKDPQADLSAYKKYYLDHIWDRTKFYDNLVQQLTGRTIKHTLLIHHNLLNALFLKDILKMYKNRGWKVIDPRIAYTDPIFAEEPKILPAGEGLVWALAKQAEKFASELRYPAEDGDYEKLKMDPLGL